MYGYDQWITDFITVAGDVVFGDMPIFGNGGMMTSRVNRESAVVVDGRGVR